MTVYLIVCVFLVLVLSIQVHANYIRTLKLDFLCSTERGPVYVRDLPWDCSSYVICVNGRAVPSMCPQGFRYQAGQSTNRCVPQDLSTPYSQNNGVIWNYIRTICRYNPKATIPDTTKCSQYLDCSVTSSGSDYVDYLLECPYPSLYSTMSGACQPFHSVMCGERPEPKTPCNYSQFQQLYGCSGHVCSPCERHHPNCLGLPNGRHSLSANPNVWIECHTERTLSVIAPDSGSRPTSVISTFAEGTNDTSRTSRRL
ncbi:CAunnamed protein product [Biomphalaria glabrata]|nr:CAunnamed protein product [Biomphalaria glabrata]